MSNIVRVRDIFKSFGSNEVLKGASIDVEEGKITSVIGQSGTGKSVLIKSIIGIIQPDSGEICLRDRNILAMHAAERRQAQRKFGYLFQDSALFDSMTVGENIAFPLMETLRIRDRSLIRRTVAEKLEWIGLPGIENTFPSALSGGMRKRVGLARTLSLQPEILLFDEPTTGLDPVLGESINDLIVRVNQEFGITCVLITHDIQATFRISDHVGFLSEGRIQAFGTPHEISHSDHPILRRFITNTYAHMEV